MVNMICRLVRSIPVPV